MVVVRSLRSAVLRDVGFLGLWCRGAASVANDMFLERTNDDEREFPQLRNCELDQHSDDIRNRILGDARPSFPVDGLDALYPGRTCGESSD